MSDAILAVDIGTSSTRAALFDLLGRRIPRSMAQQAYTLRTDRSGKAELDPQELLEAVSECIARATHNAPAIRAVGVSCFWHSVIGTDAGGNALTPIVTWADSRCRGAAEELRREFDEREIHRETGCMLRASYWPARLRWWREADRRAFEAVEKWMSPAEWLQWKITGTANCAIGMATGTGLFDPTAQAWSPRMLEAAGISAAQLLPVSDEPSDWKSVPWFPGIGDGAASNLGSGATKPDVAAVNAGTSAALRIMREGRTATAPFGLFSYRVDAKRFLVGGAASNAGNLHAWCLRELNLPRDLEEIESALACRARPEHGLTVLPFWNAERAPRWNEDDTGAILGIRQSTSSMDLLQAITEGFYFRLADIADQMVRAQESPPKWTVSGGALRSRAALRRLANVLGQPIYANPEPEASLRGAAVFAIEKLGWQPEALELGQAVLPDEAIARCYREAREKQTRLEMLLGEAKL